ncbi:transposase family protein [Lutibacter sp. B2]|nr:transposase family protein [Lutibacter sp. B2]
MLKYRGRSKSPSKTKAPTTDIATAPNKVWTWDITYLKSNIRGKYHKLYMVVDIFSRKIIGWEVWPEESGEHAAELMQKAVVSENATNKLLVLHSDKGAYVRQKVT